MEEMSIEKVESFLEREGDYTIRLFNRSVPPPKRYIFALLWFNGRTGLWMARLLNQNLTAMSEESKREFSGAKQILVGKIRSYISKGYKITVLQSGYYVPPWVQRKR